MSDKDEIARALVATARRLNPNSPEDTLRRAMRYLLAIDQNRTMTMLYDREAVRLCAPIFIREKYPSGDPVQFKSRKLGIIVVYADSFVVSRTWKAGSIKTEAFLFNEVTAEQVNATFERKTFLALRFNDLSRRPQFALFAHQAMHDSVPDSQRAVMLEIQSLLARPLA